MNDSLFRGGFYILIRLAEYSGQLPPSLSLSGIQVTDAVLPVTYGGFADIFRGSYQHTEVALKRMRVALAARQKFRKVCDC
jgi:hypothetical protein